MNTQPILSIVVPTYNMEALLPRCLDSILKPEFNGDLEVIVVNDGSKDNSLAIANDFKSKFPEILVVIDKPNGGHGSGINKGIEMAKGKYFKVLDADDWMGTEALQSFISNLKTIDVDLIFTKYLSEFVFENRKQLEFSFHNKIGYNKVISFEELNLDLIGNKPHMHAIAYRTAILKENHIQLAEKTFYVDSEYCFFPIIGVKTVVFFDIILYHYFIGREEQSVSGTGIRKNKNDLVKVANEMLDYYISNKHRFSKKQTQYYQNYLAKYLYHFFYNLFHFIDDSKWNKQQTSFIKSRVIKDVPEIVLLLKSRPMTRMIFTTPFAFSQIVFKIRRIFITNN